MAVSNTPLECTHSRDDDQAHACPMEQRRQLVRTRLAQAAADYERGHPMELDASEAAHSSDVPRVTSDLPKSLLDWNHRIACWRIDGRLGHDKRRDCWRNRLGHDKRHDCWQLAAVFAPNSRQLEALLAFDDLCSCWKCGHVCSRDDGHV